MVEELTYAGGPQHVYGLRVEDYRPGFSLALDADKFDPPQGGRVRHQGHRHAPRLQRADHAGADRRRRGVRARRTT